MFTNSIIGCIRTATRARLHLETLEDRTLLSAGPLGDAGLAEAYGKLPISFEPNLGQVDARVNYLSRGNGYTLFLTPDEAVLNLRTPGASPTGDAVLRMQVVGGNASPALTGERAMTGRVNYLKGDDPSRWLTNLPTYASVRYDQVYPGVDLVFHGSQQVLEYDFIVAPGIDPGAIAVRFDGAERLEVDAEGRLLIHILAGSIRQDAPVAYQEVAGGRRVVASAYALRDDGAVGFSIGAYDATSPLVIDPTLWYSTYLGGNAFETGKGIAADADGFAYVTGTTGSNDFPIAGIAPYDRNGNLNEGIFGVFTDLDVFVSKFSLDGSGLVYSTYLGGGHVDEGAAIAVNTLGQAALTGYTVVKPTFFNYDVIDMFRVNFPTTNNAVQKPTLIANRGLDAFVTVLNADGSDLVFSTLFGGGKDDNFLGIGPDSVGDRGYGITFDGAGNVVVVGETFVDKGLFSATNIPHKNAYLKPSQAPEGYHAFVAKFDPRASRSGNALLYGTVLGGDNLTRALAVAVDATNKVYVTGETDATDLPQVPFNRYQGDQPGRDAFVAKFDVDASGEESLLYLTYLGGSGNLDRGLGIAVHTTFTTVVFQGVPFVTVQGFAYVTGVTGSSNFPLRNAFDSTRSAAEAFVVKLNATGTNVVFSTFLGGSQDDEGRGIAVDNQGNAWITGFTGSADFHILGGFQTTLGGGRDAFVTKLSSGGALLFSTFLGGAANDLGNAIAVDPTGKVYVTGETLSTNFPTAFPLQATKSGPAAVADAFVTKIGPSFEFSTPSVNVSERERSVTLTVTRKVITVGEATVNFTVQDGTARAGLDYQPLAGTLRFRDGESKKTITIKLLPDRLVEGNETFTVTLTNPSRGTRLETPFTTEVTIADDDPSPPVASVIRNEGANGQPWVTGITIEFSTIVSLEAGAIQLLRANGKPVKTLAHSQVVNGRTIVRLTFTGGGTRDGALVAGPYKLRIRGKLVHDLAGQKLDGNQNGLPGGNHVEEFFSLLPGSNAALTRAHRVAGLLVATR